MKELTLREVLRYVVSGGVFLFALVIVHSHGRIEKLPVESLGGATVLIATALLFGTLLYSFHRAAVYPFIYVTQLKLLSTQRERTAFRITWAKPMADAEIERDMKRHSKPLSELLEWADQIHLLYTASEAIVIAFLADIFLPGGICIVLGARIDPVACLVLSTGVLLFLGGGWSHRRYLAFEDKLRSDTQRLGGGWCSIL